MTIKNKEDLTNFIKSLYPIVDVPSTPFINLMSEGQLREIQKNYYQPLKTQEIKSIEDTEILSKLIDMEKPKMTKEREPMLKAKNAILANNFPMVSPGLDATLFDLMIRLVGLQCKPVISGGCFRNWVAGKPEKDIDIFICKPNSSKEHIFAELRQKRSEKQIVAQLEKETNIEFKSISRESTEYDEEFSVFEGVITDLSDVNDGRHVKVQLIFVHQYDSPKDFIETFDFDINKGFAEVVVDTKKNCMLGDMFEWNVSIEPVMREIENKTLTLNYSKIATFEWRTKRLVQRCNMIQAHFPDHKIVIT